MNFSGPLGAATTYALRLQNSTCTITRPDSSSVTWDGTEYVPATVAVYSGSCAVQPASSQVRVVQAGDRAVSLRTYMLSVPATVDALIDDDVTINTSADADAVGLVLRVIDVPRSDFTTVRILMCEERN